MKNRIRIGCLMGGYTRGGTEKMSLLTYPLLDRTRFEVVCLFLSPARGLTREFKDSGLEVVNLDIPEDRRYLSAPILVRNLRRLVAGRGLHLVHGFGAFCDLTARLAKWGSCAPLLVTGRRSVSHRSGREGRSFLQALVERVTNKRVDLFISNTEAGRLVMTRDEGMSPQRVAVIHNGLEVRPHLPRAAPGEGEGPPVIISVAHLEHRKDPACLIRAAALLKQEGHDFRLLMVGDGPLKNEAGRLCSALSLDDRVSFLGCRRDVEILLSQAHVFALASCYEGMPVAVMEAMAAGLPVVATDVGGNAELVREGRTGYLAPRDDPALMAHSLARLLLDPVLRSEMGRAGAARIRESFNLRDKVRQLEQAYLGLMK